MALKTKNIIRDYCSWEPVEISGLSRGREFGIFARGDLDGELTWNPKNESFFGIFEFPAKNHTKGFYEIVRSSDGHESVLRRVNVRYVFDDEYFSPRWENVNAVNKFLARHYSRFLKREIIYSYSKFKRNIQLLEVSDPAVPLKNKQVIMLTGRVHNPESGMTSALFRFIKWLLETNDGKAASRDYLFLIIPFTIPLTFAEDPRAHNVNRCWFPEMTEPDLLAIRNKVLDRYLPEIWIDLHSFNEVLPLEKPEEKRKRRGDYIVAHPVNECWFDRFFSKEIAREAILAAESAGHEHRNREFFDEWVKKFSNGPYATPNENIITEHDPIGIFSGKDYARYADRGKYGPEGRNWPAMACDYGYYRCHSLNLCFECKPLHVKREDRTYHYSPGFPDSHLVKLKKLCELGKNSFSGQPTSGFPCNLIASDTDDNENSAILCAWGNDREKLRTSRKKLWQNRRAAVVRKFEGKDGKLTVSVHWFCSETVDSVIRLPFANKGKVPEIYTEKHKCRNAFLKDKFLFIPLKLLPGNNHITLK